MNSVEKKNQLKDFLSNLKTEDATEIECKDANDRFFIFFVRRHFELWEDVLYKHKEEQLCKGNALLIINLFIDELKKEQMCKN